MLPNECLRLCYMAERLLRDAEEVSREQERNLDSQEVWALKRMLRLIVDSAKEIARNCHLADSK